MLSVCYEVFFSSHNRGNSNTSKFKSHRYGCLFQSFPTSSNGKYQLIAFDGLVIYTLRHIFSVISSVVFASAYIFFATKIDSHSIAVQIRRTLSTDKQQTHPEIMKGG